MALRGLGDSVGADDVVQETMARALAALRTGRAGDIADLGAFVHGIARHVIADARRARRREVPTDGADQAPDPASGPDALALAVAAEDRERLHAAMHRLTSQDRAILRLTYFEGLTPAEVAAKLGEPAERVRKRKSRALQRLREAFFGDAGGHDEEVETTNATGERRRQPGDALESI